MKPIPVDTSDFPGIREKGQMYVDKTAFLHKLIMSPNGKLFFISRPRRFGKSLMISTLKAIFQGRRELFDGLAISKTDYDWQVHPVIHLNMGLCSQGNSDAFARSLSAQMKETIRRCCGEYAPDGLPSDNFGWAIDILASRGAKPVILIDEYDDPVAQVIASPAESEKVRAMLAPLYRQIKENEGNIRFVMITGVSKFTKMSIFSALSNLQDISFNDDYASMLGFTEAELDEYYSEHMAAHAAKMRLTPDEYRAGLRKMYNGYRFWTENGENVYNPVSINLTLAYCPSHFKCYWTDTGRPSMLMNFLKRENVLAIEPEHVTGISQSDFDVTDLSNIPVKGLLYQTGYLTIRDYEPYSELFTLGVPDEEVRRDFALVMASLCARESVAWANSLGKYLLLFDWKTFFAGLKSLFAGVAYGPHEKQVCEHSYARCLKFLLEAQGIACEQEVTQADGRADLVCTHHCGIYIFELKVDRPAAVAMSQIERRKYAEPYAADSRPIWLVGLSFCSETRQLVDCASQEYHRSGEEIKK